MWKMPSYTSKREDFYDTAKIHKDFDKSQKRKEDFMKSAMKKKANVTRTID